MHFRMHFRMFVVNVIDGNAHYGSARISLSRSLIR